MPLIKDLKDLGKVSLTPKGEFAPSETYYRLDVVTRNGSSYVVKIESCTGITPPNDSAYQLLAQAGVDPQVEITYAELKSLRDGGNLIAGMKYRMTDYVTKINGVYDLTGLELLGNYLPYAISAEHPFDLILTATSESTLSDEAKAVKHDGDTYFADSNLGAWDIRYCLDNDASRFTFADRNAGKGVIYWMRDEFGNEVGYDFKNVLLVRYALEDDGTGSPLDYDEQSRPNRYGDSYRVYLALKNKRDTGNYVSPFGNRYDFWVEDEILDVAGWSAIDQSFLDTFEAGLYYTFDHFDIYENAHTDASLNVIDDVVVKNNKIETSSNALLAIISSDYSRHGISDNVFELNNVYSGVNTVIDNVLKTDCVFNTFGNNVSSTRMDFGCYSNILGDESYNCSFGNKCFMNIFDSTCHDNVFAPYCESNDFMPNCFYNTFGNNCYSNTFGRNFCSNTFCNYCNKNTFGNYCYNNTFGNNCYFNTLGNNCSSNTFGINCYLNTLGNNCDKNTFGNYCYSNTFDEGCYSNVLGDGCVRIGIGTDQSTANDPKCYTFMSYTQRPSPTRIYLSVKLNNAFVGCAGINSQGALKTWVPADMVQ